MQTPELRRFCELDETGALLMQQAFESLGLTARSYDRILRVARTIADLDSSTSIQLPHLAEASNIVRRSTCGGRMRPA